MPITESNGKNDMGHSLVSVRVHTTISLGMINGRVITAHKKLISKPRKAAHF